MEDSFSVRVDKIFGSLSSLPSSSSSSTSSPSQPINSSLWSLTDDELRPNHWTRESDDPLSDDDNDDIDEREIKAAVTDASFPRDIDQFFVSAAGNPNPNFKDNKGCRKKVSEDDIDEEGEADEVVGGDERASSSHSLSSVKEAVDDDLDVLNSIGMDSTLDFEEEEDAYDKVAVGREEKPEERLYMSEVTDYVSHDESYNEVPNTFKEVSKDPRANHLAAKLRLKEDAETAKNFNTLHVSEQSLPMVSGGQSSTHNGDPNLKSILKRKEDQMDSKSEKRVRFDPICKKNDGDENVAEKNVTPESSNKDITVHEGDSSELNKTSLIPDYIRNPSKYTHYSFDTSSDMNEKSNRQAYADFLNLLRKSKQSEPDEVPADLSKPVVFNSKKKLRDVNVTSNETDHTMEDSVDRKRTGVIVAIGSELEDEPCEMEIDELVTSTVKAGNVKKAGRNYRAKQSLQYDDSDS